MAFPALPNENAVLTRSSHRSLLTALPQPSSPFSSDEGTKRESSGTMAVAPMNSIRPGPARTLKIMRGHVARGDRVLLKLDNMESSVDLLSCPAGTKLSMN